MTPASTPLKCGFQTKVLVPVISVMVALLAITMSLVNQRITHQFRTEAEQKLATAEAVFRNSQSIRADNLLARYRNIPNEPRFQAVFQLADPATLRQLLADLVNESASELALFTPSPEHPGTSASRPGSTVDLNQFRKLASDSIVHACSGAPNVDTIALANQLLEVTSIPVNIGGNPLGALSFGTAISESVAREFKQITRTEFLFLSSDIVVASTLQDPNQQHQAADFLRHHPTNVGEVRLDTEHFLGRKGHFATLNADNSAGYLLLLSYEPSLQTLHSTQRTLIWISLLGILISSAIIWAIVRRVTHPLRQLRDSAEAVGQGDFSQRVDVTSSDECGELAAVFNQMTTNLKTSREELEQTVTTLQTTQAQLVQSEKLSAIGEFVAGVTHELNNPLTTVIGFTELLQESGVDEKRKTYLDRITDGANRCHRIVNGLLSFARQHSHEKKPVDLHELIEASISLLSYQMRTSNIEVTTDFDCGLPRVSADPHELQQVFLNLINNARQAIEGAGRRGTIQISTRTVDNSVQLRFQDNGPGIPPENVNKVFNPFFTTKEVGKGTGLGLSVSYGIVHDHDGDITVENNPSGGVCFTIRLPFLHEPAPTEVHPIHRPSIPQTGSGQRVLVVDDEDTILKFISETLTYDGYRVDCAHDGAEALHSLRKQPYDLVICDWKMPGLTGQKVFERIHDKDPTIASRFIFITGDVATESTRQFFLDNGIICLSKPFSLDDLRQAIVHVLGLDIDDDHPDSSQAA